MAKKNDEAARMNDIMTDDIMEEPMGTPSSDLFEVVVRVGDNDGHVVKDVRAGETVGQVLKRAEVNLNGRNVFVDQQMATTSTVINGPCEIGVIVHVANG